MNLAELKAATGAGIYYPSGRCLGTPDDLRRLIMVIEAAKRYVNADEYVTEYEDLLREALNELEKP